MFRIDEKYCDVLDIFSIIKFCRPVGTAIAISKAPLQMARKKAELV